LLNFFKPIPAYVAVSVLLFSCPQAFADEPLTGFVYTTDLLPRDKFEMAQWLTWRAHKAVGEYDVVEGRTELEYGYSDRFQLAGYVNYEWARAYHDNVIDGTTLAPSTLSNLVVGPDQRLDVTRFTSFTTEGIYRFLSPYTDPVGLALYFAPSLGPDFGMTETRLVLQSNHSDDRLVLAFNLALAQQWHLVPGAPGVNPLTDSYNDYWNKTTDLNLGLAGSYRFARGWSGALELQNERGYAGFNPLKSNARTNVAYYFGPTLHYAGQHFFATATYVSQLAGARDYAHAEPDFVVGGRSYSAGNERFRVRAKFGWYF